MFGNYSALPRPLHAVVIAQSIPFESVPDMPSLYASYHPRLFRFGLPFSDSKRKAEALQDAFLDLIRNPLQFDSSQGSAVALLYGMVRNRLRSARRSEREEALEEDGTVDEELLLHLERGQRVAAVKGAILGLPEHYREVVVLCGMEEFSYEDAASALGIPLGKVRSRLNRAKQQLKLRLIEFEGGQG